MTGTDPPRQPMSQVVRWLRQYRGQYTDETLRKRLLGGGYDPDVVARAFELATQGQPPAGQPEPSAPGIAWRTSASSASPPEHRENLMKAYVAGLAALIGLPWLVSNFAPAEAGIVALLVFVGIIVAIVGAHNQGRSGVVRGLVYSIVTIVVVPVIAVVGLFGFCLIAGAPWPA